MFPLIFYTSVRCPSSSSITSTSCITTIILTRWLCQKAAPQYLSTMQYSTFVKHYHNCKGGGGLPLQREAVAFYTGAGHFTLV